MKHLVPVMKKYNLRVVIGSADGPRSNVWRVFSKRSQVYVSYGNLGGVAKLSFIRQRSAARLLLSNTGHL